MGSLILAHPGCHGQRAAKRADVVPANHLPAISKNLTSLIHHIIGPDITKNRSNARVTGALQRDLGSFTRSQLQPLWSDMKDRSRWLRPRPAILRSLYTYNTMHTTQLSRALSQEYSNQQNRQLKCGIRTTAGWQVTLCDPIWHVSFPQPAAVKAKLMLTAIHCLLLLHFYLTRCWQKHKKIQIYRHILVI